MHQQDMKNMKILVDTNVIMDYVANRIPYAEASGEVVRLCSQGEIEACVAAHTVSNLFYILRNHLSEDERRDVLKKVCKIFYVVGIDQYKIEAALNNSDFKDFEDCLQMECAINFKADFIVTRNEKDFNISPIKAMGPSSFIEILKN